MADAVTCPACWLPTRSGGVACPICRARLPVRVPVAATADEPAEDIMGLPLMLFAASAVVVGLAFLALMAFGVAVAVVGK